VFVFRHDRFEKFSVAEKVQLESLSELDLPYTFFKPGKLALANPSFGTTSTHVLDWMNRLKEKGLDPQKKAMGFRAHGVLFCQGNSDVVRKVLAGQAGWGMTDSDDVFRAQAQGKPVDFVIPESIKGEGPLLIPNTVAMIRNGPHPREAKLLVDFLVSKEVEEMLAEGESKQIPLGKDLRNKYEGSYLLGDRKIQKVRIVRYEEILSHYEEDLRQFKKWL
jgi:ABC-type Fe3+ transport system substrate-binding protein